MGFRRRERQINLVWGKQRAGAAHKVGCWRRVHTRNFTKTSFNTQMKMRGLFSTLLVVLVALMIVTSEAGKNKKEKSKNGKGGGDCTEWRFGSCVANNGDCGAGTREGTCNEQTKKVKCKVPCNWKKDFGADCKYKFGNWGECDVATSKKSRSGTLHKALYNVDCQQTISVSKPCTTKVKNKPKGKKGKGKGN